MQNNFKSPLWIMVRKETGDHIRSWRFIVMLILVVLTFLGTMYMSWSNLKTAVGNTSDPNRGFIYLKLLTTSDKTLPTFHIFLGFLGPLLGIALGFDAINSERNNGTLIRLMAQPVYRDNLLLSKFFAGLIVVGVLFLSLVLLMIGAGFLFTGVTIEWTEVFRILGFVIMSVMYVGFWLGLSILLSICFRSAATSALTAIGIWLFFAVFYQIILNVILNAVLPSPDELGAQDLAAYNHLVLSLTRIAPNQLFTDAVTTLLIPTIRSVGPLTMEQMAGAIPTPLPVKESFMIVWPQVTGLIAGTMACFAASYYLFMRKEIRS